MAILVDISIHGPHERMLGPCATLMETVGFGTLVRDMKTSILLEIILKLSGSSVFLSTQSLYLSCCWVDALLKPLQLSLCNCSPLTSPCSLNCVVRHRKPSFDGTFRYSILKELEYLYDQTGLQVSLLLTRTQAQNPKQKKCSKDKKEQLGTSSVEGLVS